MKEKGGVSLGGLLFGVLAQRAPAADTLPRVCIMHWHRACSYLRAATRQVERIRASDRPGSSTPPHGPMVAPRGALS